MKASHVVVVILCIWLLFVLVWSVGSTLDASYDQYLLNLVSDVNNLAVLNLVSVLLVLILLGTRLAENAFYRKKSKVNP